MFTKQMSTISARALFVLMLLVAVFALQGCSTEESTESAEEPAETVAEIEEAKEETTTGLTAVPGKGLMYTASYVPTGKEIAVITTNKGVIKFEFYPEDAPNTVAAFIEQAQDGFYDGTKFHRVIADFMAQGGDPLSKTDDPAVGTGGPGHNLEAEFNERLHLEGTVAMARSQSPDSAGSQFYICFAPQPSLDNQYTVFGQVTEGLDVLHTIVIGDVMESVTIENAAE